VGEGHLFHLGSTLHFSGLAYFSRFGSLFQSFLNSLTAPDPYRLKTFDQLMCFLLRRSFSSA
ncbi:hypothetical protein, partial [Pseudomonas syringae group genomosp. 3]|uniref:hypothetical protein n=1 Tax=Pseudomonas syringae group genomosp. 3 TaxID=251701 RepID=UPI001E4F2307